MSAVSHQAENRSKGFTLVELLVVIVIMGLLIALLLPAVQSAREASRRGLCRNNLKQLGIACHNYSNAKKVLPPGYSAAAGTAPDATTPGWGWTAHLLPYMDETALFQQLDFTQALETQKAIQSQIAVLICPSDIPPSGPFEVDDATFTPICLAAATSYAASVGSDASEVDDMACNGVFYRNSRTRIADITDGTSKTVFLGERAWADTNGIWVGAPNTAVARPGESNPWQTATASAPCLILAHNNWINIKTDSDGGLDDFSSKHSGGANILFGDGSVRFIVSIIVDGPEHQAFWAMGTRSAGDDSKALE